MSDALKRLEEIEAARTPGGWEAVLEGDPRGQPVMYYRGLVALIAHDGTARTLAVVSDGRAVPKSQWEANARLIAMAPLLARLVRSVAEAPCARGCEDECDAAIAKGLRQAPPCHRCRIRRELAGGVRAQAAPPAVSIKSESWMCIPHQYEGEAACPKCEIERGVR